MTLVSLLRDQTGASSRRRSLPQSAICYGFEVVWWVFAWFLANCGYLAALRWFTEGFDTRDLKEAKALLKSLAA